MFILAQIWSTWAQYKVNIDQDKVLQFAQDIRDNGFADSQLEVKWGTSFCKEHIILMPLSQIDDNWESCYGEAEFGDKFPDAPGMVQQLKDMGFRVTLWIHPFINLECPSWTEAADNGYFVLDGKGVTGLTYWWQGSRAGYVDFTNEDAVDWWTVSKSKI